MDTTTTATTLLEYHAPSDHDLRCPEYLDAYAQGREQGQQDQAAGTPAGRTIYRLSAAQRGYADGYRFGYTQ